MPGGSDFALPSRTKFYAVGGDIALGSGVFLSGEAAMGSTQIEGRFLTMDRAAVSSNWRLSLAGGCFGICDQLSLTVWQPLRIESGSFSAYLADIPA
ncbi:hypothetical protein LTR94_030318, partial [Friedmanniomyces endolithicus]